MTAPLLSLAGRLATSARLCAGYADIWTADVTLDQEATLSGAVVLTIGGTELRGTIDGARSGTFLLSSHFRVIGGAAGWRKTVKARPYHNDATLKRSRVLADLARDVGETLTLPADVDASYLGLHFVREAAPASRIIEQLLPSTRWWVGFDGVTVAGARPSRMAPPSVELLDYQVRTRSALLALDRAESVEPGTIIRDARLSSPLQIRHVEIDAAGSGLRAQAFVMEVVA